MADKIYDAAVIGGGPAGYVAAIRAAQLGGRVVLFERDALGGTCLNRGCIPTKTLLRTAEVVDNIRNAAFYGVSNCGEPEVDLRKVIAHKDDVVRQLTDGVGTLLRSNGVAVVNGEAILSGRNEISCAGERYHADSIILCTGSEASKPAIPGADDPDVLSSTQLLEMTQLPERLVIIGGGVIGCEFACAFRRFGCEVAIVEAEERLIPLMDRELTASLKEALEKSGINVRTSTKIDRIQREDGRLKVVCGGGEGLAADKVLLAVGRRVDLSCLGAMREHIRVENGVVVTDAAMRTSVSNIYAAGDMNGRLMLAHTAFKMGETAAENAMGGQSVCDLSAVPSCIYTIPQAASVGMTEEEAAERYGRDAIRIGRFPLRANGRALSSGEAEGYVKVVMLEKYSELCGVHIFGAQAAEMIAEPAIALNAELTAQEAAEAIHAHPSFSEAFKEACGDALGRCIHLPKAGGRALRGAEDNRKRNL